MNNGEGLDTTSHEPSIWDHFNEVVGGSADEVTAKTLGGILAAVVANLSNWASATGPVLVSYAVLLLLDVVFGSTLAVRNGERFKFIRLMTGPAKKLGLTAGLFVGAAVIDSVVPGTFILTGVSGYICVAQFLDVGDKYHKLTGSKVIQVIKDKLASWIGEGKNPD